MSWRILWTLKVVCTGIIIMKEGIICIRVLVQVHTCAFKGVSSLMLERILWTVQVVVHCIVLYEGTHTLS